MAKNSCGLVACLSTTAAPHEFFGHMADDQLSDVYHLKAASAVARVLAIRQNESTPNTTEALREVELATRSVERQLKYLEDFQTWGETVRSHGEKIAECS